MATVGASQQLVVHQVPAGYTSILKNIWLNNGEPASNNIQVLVRPVAGQPDIYLYAAALTPAESKELVTWIVLEDGDTLIARSLFGIFRIWASGAILPNAPLS